MNNDRGGSLSGVQAHELGAFASRGAPDSAGVEADAIGEAVFGCIEKAGSGAYNARHVALADRLPTKRWRHEPWRSSEMRTFPQEELTPSVARAPSAARSAPPGQFSRYGWPSTSCTIAMCIDGGQARAGLFRRYVG